MSHKDPGNCLRLPIDRDRNKDVEKYKLLRNIRKEIISLLNAKE
ncbi:MAG: hypothetical protein ACFE8A_12385 [Candidatus Hodarchaeota archaeon]